MVRFMTTQEFLKMGYLQEANRQFFHPIGLALSVAVDDSGRVLPSVMHVCDARGDPEGFCFQEGVLKRSKAQVVLDAQLAKAGPRQKALGYVIQPLPEENE